MMSAIAKSEVSKTKNHRRRPLLSITSTSFVDRTTKNKLKAIIDGKKLGTKKKKPSKTKPSSHNAESNINATRTSLSDRQTSTAAAASSSSRSMPSESVYVASRQQHKNSSIGLAPSLEAGVHTLRSRKRHHRQSGVVLPPIEPKKMKTSSGKENDKCLDQRKTNQSTRFSSIGPRPSDFSSKVQERGSMLDENEGKQMARKSTAIVAETDLHSVRSNRLETNSSIQHGSPSVDEESDSTHELQQVPKPSDRLVDCESPQSTSPTLVTSLLKTKSGTIRRGASSIEMRRSEETWKTLLVSNATLMSNCTEKKEESPTPKTTANKSDPSLVNHTTSQNIQQTGVDIQHQPTLAALDPIPLSHKQEIAANQSGQKAPGANYVKLSLRNSAGSCLGAKNRKSKRKSQIQWEKNKKKGWHAAGAAREETSSHGTSEQHFGGALTLDGIDPVDDLVDGALSCAASNKKPGRSNPIPLCSGHHQPCKLLTVRKTSTGNKGRQFYCCALDRGEQCNFFKWMDDTPEAVQAALMANRSFSGFVGRQVQDYMESLKVMTVPELRDAAKQNGLRLAGKKKELLMRLSIWVRNEIVQSSSKTELEDTIETPEQLASFDISDDSSSSCSEDLEFDEAPEFEQLSNSVAQDKKCSSIAIKRPGDTKKVFPIERRSDLLEALRQYFGHSSFRGGQEWAIRRCLENKRSMLVAPTGSGKSLCYALPAALMDGVCIVVSPLLALIQDQIRVLPPSIPAATLSGQITNVKLAATIDDIARGRIKILFVSPERLISAAFRRLFLPKWNKETRQREKHFPNVSLLCVDEAHCLSQWAHNFRPAYLRFGSMLDLIRPRSVLAITATAGPRVVPDVCSSLEIDFSTANGGRHIDLTRDSGVLQMESDRDNIEVACEVLESQEERISRLIKLLKRPGGHTAVGKRDGWDGCLSSGSVIVYVWRQRDAEAVAENIQSSEIEGGVVVYHGGMDSGTRANAQSKFIRGKARICVATVAFGLGINKADIEGVIHLYLSSSLEHYLQEIGRAGRDGRQAIAFALILKDEVLVRHSLAHSDMIVMSQVKALFDLLQSKTKAFSSLTKENPNQLSLGLPIEEAMRLCGCKTETIETILSLLQASVGKKLLRLDGFFYDKVKISPRRRPIDDLAEKEDTVKAILSCCHCLEPAAGGKRNAQVIVGEHATVANEYGFGTFEFSAAHCANCLGPDAEPRHVFAALRRLQQSREVDFALETGTTGRALNIRILEEGIPIFSAQNHVSIKALAYEVFDMLRQSTALSAEKTLQLDRILHAVSASSDPQVLREESKSQTVTLFQRLSREYFEDVHNGDGLIEGEDSFDRVPRANALIRDLESVVLHLTNVANCSSSSRCLGKDVTALNATKFLHGIVPHGTVLGQCRQHHLFGRWQRTMFSQLYEEATQIICTEDSDSSNLQT